MTSVTLSRGGRSVTFNVYESGGNLHVARDIGKPKATVHRVAQRDPRIADHRSSSKAFTIVGQLVGSSAYADARTIAEDIVKPHSGGQTASLDLSSVSGLSTYDVAFVGGNSLRLGYPPGQGQWVSLQLQAVVANHVTGGDTQGATGSTGSGSGPLKLTDGSNSITVSSGLDVERKVGRPGAETRHSSKEDPYVLDPVRSAADEFEISATWTTSASSKQNTLVEDIISPPRGYGTLTLDFQGLYSLGSYTVMPVDAQGARVSWSAGESGTVRIETLKLRVADNS